MLSHSKPLQTSIQDKDSDMCQVDNWSQKSKNFATNCLCQLSLLSRDIVNRL